MARGKPEIDQERCKGCEMCISVCPEHILELSEGYNKQGQRYPVCIAPDKCTACMSCAIICPDVAIEIWRLVS